MVLEAIAPVVRTLFRCRVCNRGLEELYSFRPLPLVNKYADAPDKDAERYPLTLVQCSGCGLVQIAEEIDKDILYGGDYAYIPSTSETMVRHFSGLASYGRPGLRVLDIGSNDGTLLQQFKERGCDVMGVEPAPNLVGLANSRGITTEHGLFDETVDLGKFDIITATNLLANCHNIASVLHGVRNHLTSGGKFIVETPDWNNLKRIGSFDSVYHEHMAYFTAQTLRATLRKHGLVPTETQELPVHGGSLRVFAQRGNYQYDDLPIEDHSDFDPRLTIDPLKAWVGSVDGEIAGYGAPAKATVLINEAEIADRISYVTDSVPYKQGKYLPGTDIPIRKPEELGSPDHILVLCWNFRDEVEQKLRGREITFPIPRLEVV